MRLFGRQSKPQAKGAETAGSGTREREAARNADAAALRNEQGAGTLSLITVLPR